jgi:uncharacterized membrane protein YgcG
MSTEVDKVVARVQGAVGMAAGLKALGYTKAHHVLSKGNGDYAASVTAAKLTKLANDLVATGVGFVGDAAAKEALSEVLVMMRAAADNSAKTELELIGLGSGSGDRDKRLQQQEIADFAKNTRYMPASDQILPSPVHALSCDSVIHDGEMPSALWDFKVSNATVEQKAVRTALVADGDGQSVSLDVGTAMAAADTSRMGMVLEQILRFMICLCSITLKEAVACSRNPEAFTVMGAHGNAPGVNGGPARMMYCDWQQCFALYVRCVKASSACTPDEVKALYTLYMQRAVVAGREGRTNIASALDAAMVTYPLELALGLGARRNAPIGLVTPPKAKGKGAHEADGARKEADKRKRDSSPHRGRGGGGGGGGGWGGGGGGGG